MPNKKYTKEYKLDAVRLALTSDKSQAQIARDLGLRDNVLYTWVSKYRSEILKGSHGMTPEQELTALKKEVSELRQERDILKKAAAYDGRDAGARTTQEQLSPLRKSTDEIPIH